MAKIPVAPGAAEHKVTCGYYFGDHITQSAYSRVVELGVQPQMVLLVKEQYGYTMAYALVTREALHKESNGETVEIDGDTLRLQGPQNGYSWNVKDLRYFYVAFL
ncbi:hypothetical protein AAEU42_01100 [Pseudoflavonifractor phocaeensis]|uniref:hypothetical protein n=1 Tax=Pseudoflavonifractor phocaeensis TaxID=1870988 RepID=UPI00313E7B05